MKKIVVKRSDGGVSIVIPTLEATSGLILRDVLSIPNYVSHREIEDSQIPEDRYFRDAWTDDNPTDTIDIDIPKAKIIKLNEFRDLRRPLLEKLDVAYLQADEAGETQLKQEIAAKKQELRDVTEVSLPDTVDELKNFLPNILK
jgi:hypothetical protein